MIESNKSQLASLQVGRGLAAMSVVFAHAALGTRDFVAPLPQIAQSVFSFGWLGVDFFFVLSGFIIY